MNAEEYLKSLDLHNSVWDMGDFEYTEKQLINFAEEYHQAKLKLLNIDKFEQLQNFVSGFYKWHKKQNYLSVKREDWDEYIKTL